MLKRKLIQWKQLIKDKTRKRYRRRILLYLSCLLLALGFWFLNILNRAHRFELRSNLQFINLPEDKALSTKETRTISFTVEGSGWNFIRSRMQLISDTLIVDYRSIQDKEEIELNKLLLDFESQWSRKMKIMNVYPTKINFVVERKRIKKVPVDPILNLKFAEGYDLTEKINWYPDSVYISGPYESIKRIKSIKTIPVNLHNLNANNSIDVALDLKLYPNINTKVKTTRINIPVEQYTERIIKINISQRNESVGMITFPSTCILKFKVALSNYNTIIEQSFKVIAEPNHDLKNRLRLKVLTSPRSIKDLQIIPETVEYMIVKK
jgi:hypothetical protein